VQLPRCRHHEAVCVRSQADVCLLHASAASAGMSACWNRRYSTPPSSMAWHMCQTRCAGHCWDVCSCLESLLLLTELRVLKVGLTSSGDKVHHRVHVYMHHAGCSSDAPLPVVSSVSACSRNWEVCIAICVVRPPEHSCPAPSGACSMETCRRSLTGHMIWAHNATYTTVPFASCRHQQLAWHPI
jgi:hypothetical protein